MSHAPKDSDRCEFTYSSGRRCRMARLAPEEPLCFHHWERQQQEDAAAKAADQIIGSEVSLHTHDGIRKALANVFCQLVRNRISARNAAVLGYVGQLMLGSAPSLERTIKSFLPALQLAIKVGHQNAQSNSKSDAPLYKMALDEFEVTKRLFEQFNTFDTMSTEERQRFAKFIATFLTKKEGAASASASP